MNKNGKYLLIGYWRITKMELWNADYFDSQVPAYLRLNRDFKGRFQFGLIEGEIYNPRFSFVDGIPRIEFLWDGTDENDSTSGHGWIKAKGNQAQGRIFFHQGDATDFTAQRQDEDVNDEQ